MEKDVWNFNVILANCARETGLLFILRNIAAMQMINFIKLKIASVPLSGKILTLTENTSFLPRKEGVKAFLFTLLKKNELFLLPLAATGKFLHLSSSVFRFRWSHVQHSLVREEVSKKWPLNLVMNDAIQLPKQLFQAICQLRQIHLFGYTLVMVPTNLWARDPRVQKKNKKVRQKNH